MMRLPKDEGKAAWTARPTDRLPCLKGRLPEVGGDQLFT